MCQTALVLYVLICLRQSAVMSNLGAELDKMIHDLSLCLRGDASPSF